MENRRMVVDTSIFIDYLRAKGKAETTLRKLPDDAKIYVSPVTLYGLYMGATNAQKWKDVKILTEDIPLLPFSKEVAEKSAFLYQELKKKN
jgi:tRNA(fMet)-specific endonuclease VapC